MAALTFQTTGRDCFADVDIVDSQHPEWAASVHDPAPFKRVLAEAFRVVDPDGNDGLDSHYDVQLAATASGLDLSISRGAAVAPAATPEPPTVTPQELATALTKQAAQASDTASQAEVVASSGAADLRKAADDLAAQATAAAAAEAGS